ncbi:MAG: carbohydrate ABC transporter permease [Phycisphaerae bacterium]|nr:carbohydrate ABC transporter permease [Phycisphaerae bacterium]
MKPQTAVRIFYLGLVVAASLGFAAPLLWMVSTSLKPLEDVGTSRVALVPVHPERTGQYLWENFYEGRPTFVDEQGVERVGYEGVWTSDNVNFPLFLRNTLIVAVLSVSGMVLSSAIVAYGFAKVRWRGRGVFFAICLATMMVPFPAIMVPSYFLFKWFGWIGTLQPLWVPAWFANAFNVFLLRQFYLQIPEELSDAARIDGLSHWGIFWRIILPLARPALAVVAVFHLTYVWNDFLGPLVFLHHQHNFTLALGLQFYMQQHGGTPWNLLMAATTLTVAPLLILFALTQRFFLPGLATSGLKG